jgi:hypothetical protein
VVVELKGLYEETVASQLKVWDDEINHLDARVDIILAQAEDHYYCLLKALRAKERELRDRLLALKAAPDDRWETLEVDLARTTDEMKSAISRAEEELAQLRE